MSSERAATEQLDADLRRACDAADALVAAAGELRSALDALSESVRAAIAEAVAVTEAAAAAAAAGPKADGDDGPDGGGEAPEGARLVALDMVLDGRPRAEVAERLREEFGLADSESLLDDVYGRVEG